MMVVAITGKGGANGGGSGGFVDGDGSRKRRL